jgi:hypothetical protein
MLWATAEPSSKLADSSSLAAVWKNMVAVCRRVMRWVVDVDIARYPDSPVQVPCRGFGVCVVVLLQGSEDTLAILALN